MRCCMAFTAVALFGVGSTPSTAFSADQPELERRSSVSYRCGGGEQIDATYYGLRDRSLDFVRLQLPDGRELTLPEVASASGARFSADREFTWWIKGTSGFLQRRDAQGEWRVTLNGCDSAT